MKGGRSHHRTQSSDPPPPDEWVDGSWTVDCICGVTFDDGEEMVKCDECGVWVHTRCSRYIKGDETFSCDKCKSKMITATIANLNAAPRNNHNNANDNAVNGTEETEVAQFLIELPTKTIPMENNNNYNNNNNNNSGIASRRPFKLWTEIPMEERVHVQGIPGGDPSLFSGGGLSSIFGPQLWKCTGYVPKKFNFRYREFPSWKDEDDDDDGGDGAGVLLSFSKETAANATAAVVAGAASPVAAALVDLRGGGGGGGERKGGLKEGERVQNNGVKKERSLLRPFVVHNSKRKKEEFGGSSSKDRSSGKKRVRTSSEKEVDPKKRSSSNSSKTAFTPTSDAKPLEFYEDRGPKISKDDTRGMKNKNLKDVAVQEHISKGCFAVDTIMEEPNNNLTTTEDSSDPSFADATRPSFSVGDVLPEEKTGHKAPSLVEVPLKTDDAVTSVLKHNEVGTVSSKDKDGDCLAVDNADGAIVIRSSVTPHDEGLCGSVPENIDNQVSQDSDCNLPSSSAKGNVKMKREDDDDNVRKLSNFHSSPIRDLKNNEKLSDHVSDIVKVNDAVVTSLPLCENKLGDVDRLSVVVTDDHTNKPDVLFGNSSHSKQEAEGSEGSMETQKGFSETKDVSDSVKDPHKKLASLGKSSPTSSTMNSKSLAHDLKSEESEIPNSFAKHGVMADNNTRTKNEICQSDSVRDEIPKKSVRDRPKSSLNANSKGLHSSRSTQNSVSKQGSSDARDSVFCSSSKSSLVHQTGNNLGSSETNASLHHQKALQGQHKGSSSVPPKAEKFNQTNINPSTLSDEELALLLHQELNSSPRVPRVPRARHAGSLPQLTSASSTSMLIKRTSSVGGKDHYLVPRRKYKDASREGLCSSRELEDEAKRIEKEKGPSSSDQRKQDVASVEDASVKEDGRGSMAAANSSTNNVVATSSIPINSPHSPPEDQNLPSVRNSPRSISDDDTTSAGRPVHRTLPGLINDIMSKGRRMTYEELCNAVLPHWHNLRKHNGERYAYSSHSQAVLDCLRNRHEWARLVDRGPKTNSNRKKRSKLDAEDSDDSGYGKGKATKEVEGKNFELQKEDFPKGKRKARKRRRLALQGRAVKDVRRRQKTDSLTDEDGGPFSNSSEESMFSEEDEIQGGRIGQAGSTSDEAGSA